MNEGPTLNLLAIQHPGGLRVFSPDTAHLFYQALQDPNRRRSLSGQLTDGITNGLEHYQQEAWDVIKALVSREFQQQINALTDNYTRVGTNLSQFIRMGFHYDAINPVREVPEGIQQDLSIVADFDPQATQIFLTGLGDFGQQLEVYTDGWSPFDNARQKTRQILRSMHVALHGLPIIPFKEISPKRNVFGRTSEPARLVYDTQDNRLLSMQSVVDILINTPPYRRGFALIADVAWGANAALGVVGYLRRHIAEIPGESKVKEVMMQQLMNELAFAHEQGDVLNDAFTRSLVAAQQHIFGLDSQSEEGQDEDVTELLARMISVREQGQDALARLRLKHAEKISAFQLAPYFLDAADSAAVIATCSLAYLNFVTPMVLALPMRVYTAFTDIARSLTSARNRRAVVGALIEGTHPSMNMLTEGDFSLPVDLVQSFERLTMRSPEALKRAGFNYLDLVNAAKQEDPDA